jgi:hypothetical protein
MFVAAISVQAQDKPTDVNVNATITTDAPKTAQAVGQCLIVAAEQHRINTGHGLVGLAMVAGSKGKWDYRDSYNLAPANVKAKYVEKDITNLIKQGVHVIVVDPASKEVADARISCQGLVPQK